MEKFAVQSIGGSLRLPLLQNGACPFPCPPLLSALMLVTHTHREILPLLPSFRIMAMSMERLEIRLTGITTVPVEVVNLDQVVMLARQSTASTASTLSFEPCGPSGIGLRMPSSSAAPVHPIPLRGTPVATHWGRPWHGHLAVESHVRLR
jgi:hypothetical protein